MNDDVAVILLMPKMRLNSMDSSTDCQSPTVIKLGIKADIIAHPRDRVYIHVVMTNRGARKMRTGAWKNFDCHRPSRLLALSAVGSDRG